MDLGTHVTDKWTERIGIVVAGAQREGHVTILLPVYGPPAQITTISVRESDLIQLVWSDSET